MNEHFKVGEIAIAQNFEQFPEYNGCECQVINGLEFRGLVLADMTARENVLRYRVEFPDGMRLGPLPHQLRKKIPPQRLIAANDEQYFLEVISDRRAA
jgi:hypothetical protein